MESSATPDWDDYWRGLRGRRTIAAVALVAFLPVWFALGPPGLLLAFAGLLAAYWHLRRWPCPRCHQPIVGARFSTFPLRCVSCDLLVFGHVVDIEQPAVVNPDAFRLPTGRRRFIAWYQIVAGAGLMILSAFAGAEWWQLLFMEALAAMSCAAGVWLLRDEARGYALTRTMQWVQLVQVQSPWLTYVAMSGVGIVLTHANGGINFSSNIMSKFLLLVMPEQSFGVAVNLWAALLLLVLLQARPGVSEPDEMPGVPDGGTMSSSNAYDVALEHAAPRGMAAVHARVPAALVGAQFRVHLDQVYAAGRNGTVQLDGQNIFVYHPVAGAPDQVDVEFGVGATAPFADAGNVVYGMTPGGDVATTTHWGDYRALGDAHAAVVAWCSARELALAGPRWEVYGHWREGVTPRTDVYYLLAPRP